MKKIEFAISMALRLIILIWALTSLINEGEWGFVWNGIGYFVIVVTMTYSSIVQVVLLYRWNPQEKKYYQF